jgi:hypothetical protein
VSASFTGRQGKPDLFDLEDTADVKSWLADFTASVNNITGSHQYVFERKVVAGEVKAVMSCKQFAACNDDKGLFTVGPLLKVRVTRPCFCTSLQCKHNCLHKPPRDIGCLLTGSCLAAGSGHRRPGDCRATPTVLQARGAAG